MTQKRTDVIATNINLVDLFFVFFGKAVKQVNHIRTSYQIARISKPIFTKKSYKILSNNSNYKFEKILQLDCILKCSNNFIVGRLFKGNNKDFSALAEN